MFGLKLAKNLNYKTKITVRAHLALRITHISAPSMN